MTTDLATLRANVETLAREERLDVLEVVTMLQAAAAASGQDETLDALCALKREFIDETLDDDGIDWVFDHETGTTRAY